tara:strand:- start:475 stop:837 length:363 start_codon:yes stop_codon:yes gene_type:complete
MIFKLISTLPNEIKEIIYYFISNDVKSNLTKKQFILNYENKIKKIPFYNSYMRYIIRNEHCFILTLNLKQKKTHWHNLKNWKYNGRLFSNYLTYLKYYANRQNKNNIYQIIKRIETKKKY